MKYFIQNQVLGSRLKVVATTEQLAPSPYNLRPQATERSVK
jgi:hypothetical protein